MSRTAETEARFTALESILPSIQAQLSDLQSDNATLHAEVKSLQVKLRLHTPSAVQYRRNMDYLFKTSIVKCIVHKIVIPAAQTLPPAPPSPAVKAIKTMQSKQCKLLLTAFVKQKGAPYNDLSKIAQNRLTPTGLIQLFNDMSVPVWNTVSHPEDRDCHILSVALFLARTEIKNGEIIPKTDVYSESSDVALVMATMGISDTDAAIKAMPIEEDLPGGLPPPEQLLLYAALYTAAC